MNLQRKRVANALLAPVLAPVRVRPTDAITTDDGRRLASRVTEEHRAHAIAVSALLRPGAAAVTDADASGGSRS
jgi:hypothetical protein